MRAGCINWEICTAIGYPISRPSYFPPHVLKSKCLPALYYCPPSFSPPVQLSFVLVSYLFYRAVILKWRLFVNDYWKVTHNVSKRKSINFRVKRSSIFFVSQIYEPELTHFVDCSPRSRFYEFVPT